MSSVTVESPVFWGKLVASAGWYPIRAKWRKPWQAECHSAANDILPHITPAAFESCAGTPA